MTLTEEQERFAKQFLPAASKVVRTRTISVRHVSGRGSSTRKQGARLHDVKPDTLKKRVLEFPDQFLQVLLLRWITGNRQSKVRKGINWSE